MRKEWHVLPQTQLEETLRPNKKKPIKAFLVQPISSLLKLPQHHTKLCYKPKRKYAHRHKDEVPITELKPVTYAKKNPNVTLNWKKHPNAPLNRLGAISYRYGGTEALDKPENGVHKYYNDV